MREQSKLMSLLAAIMLCISSCGGGVSETGTTQVSPPANNSVKPRFAYAVNGSDNTVSMYTINAETGQLRHNGYITTATNPISIAVDPSNRFAYVATSGSNNNISVYRINQNNGVLSFVGFATAGTNPRSITVDPSGKFVYAVNSDSANISMFEITSNQGELLSRQTVNVGTHPNPITFHPSGKFAYVPTPLTNSVIVYDVNGKGELASKGTATTGSTPRALAIDPSGKFAFTTNYNGDTVSMHTVNADTGQLRYNGSIETAAKPVSISIDPSGQFVYVANNNSNNISTYTINATTGKLTFAGNVDTGTNPYSVTVDSTGHFLYAANQMSNDLMVYTVNQNTGSLTKASTITGRSGPVSLAIASGLNAVKYVPRFAYAMKRGGSLSSDNSILSYTLDPTNGTLHYGGTTAINYAFASAEVDPFGRFMYLNGAPESGQNHSISAYTINQSTGALTLNHVYGSPGGSSTVVDPSGRFAYIAGTDLTNGSGKIWIYNIDQVSGSLTPGTPATVAGGTTPVSITIDPSGRFAYVANTDSHDILVYSIDAVTGALTRTNGGILFPTNSDPRSVIFEPSGKFAYLVHRFNDVVPSQYRVSIYAINQVSGALTTAISSNLPIGNGSFLIEPSGRRAYVTNNSSSINPPIYSIAAYSIDQNTGNLSALTGGSVRGDNRILKNALIEPSGKYLYAGFTSGAGGEITVYNIDQTVGTLNLGPSISVDSDLLAIAGSIQ